MFIYMTDFKSVQLWDLVNQAKVLTILLSRFSTNLFVKSTPMFILTFPLKGSIRCTQYTTASNGWYPDVRCSNTQMTIQHKRTIPLTQLMLQAALSLQVSSLYNQCLLFGLFRLHSHFKYLHYALKVCYLVSSGYTPTSSIFIMHSKFVIWSIQATLPLQVSSLCNQSLSGLFRLHSHFKYLHCTIHVCLLLGCLHMPAKAQCT